MDMDFNGDVASLDAEILQLPEVSPLAIKTNPHVAEKLFDQWLSLPDTVSLDDGILVIPIVADSPPKLRTKKGLAVEFHDRLAFSVAELNKPVAKNGSIESEVPTDGKKMKETKNSQKLHFLLLQLIAAQTRYEPDDICDFEL
ncbi:serine/threonine protein phosphatase 2A regulatory subunit B''beta-like [Forsythia ovata]|uniref:Serine/threonine protein phosphatase 2A regulatory subunit B''beta-like n=1 Tax=Forsythia ovata TaxID=205694 RepID=A0ABD1UVI8_9LAMI